MSAILQLVRGAAEVARALERGRLLEVPHDERAPGIGWRAQGYARAAGPSAARDTAPASPRRRARPEGESDEEGRRA